MTTDVKGFQLQHNNKYQLKGWTEHVHKLLSSLIIFNFKTGCYFNVTGLSVIECSCLFALSSPWVSRQRHVTSGLATQSARFARSSRWVAYWTFIDHFTASSHTAVCLWSFFRFRKPLSRGYVFVSMGCIGVLVFLNRVFILPTARFVWSLPRTRWRHTPHAWD